MSDRNSDMVHLHKSPLGQQERSRNAQNWQQGLHKPPNTNRPEGAICGRLRFGKGTSCNPSWSVQPYVRPVDAAHQEAAGHNALR